MAFVLDCSVSSMLVYRRDWRGACIEQDQTRNPSVAATDR